MEKSSSSLWYSSMTASVLLIIRAGLRLAAGPPTLGQGPGAERMGQVFLLLLIGVLIYGLANLSSLTKGREGMRGITAVLLALGLVSGVALLFIGD